MKYLVLLLLSTSATAGNYNAHTYPVETHTETVIEKTVVTTIDNTGIALGIAYSQLQFDKNISGLQFGIGGGFYDTQSAIAFGLAKQIKEKTILNISVGSEGKKSSVGIGLNFTLK